MPGQTQADGYAVEAAGLTKSYGGMLVLDGVDLRVSRGTCYALLGPNGAGKTTTVRILSTLVRPDGGSARVAGFDVIADRRRVRRSISLTGQYAALDEPATGEENLRAIARLSGLSRSAARRRAADLLTQFGLEQAARRRVSTYSGGMRRRLDLAAGLTADPSVIFLDEPTTGLDLPSRMIMWQVVAELVSSGVTVLLTTQYLEEADRLADRVAVLDAGRIVAEGTPGDLKQRVAQQRLEVTMASPAAFEAVRRSRHDVAGSDPAALLVELPTDGSAAHVRQLLDELDPQHHLVRRFSVRGATLDDVFLALTGHAAVSGKAALHV
jgi:ABC-2 type transport system ATP-binding protein